jgi:hypothetical protein
MTRIVTRSIPAARPSGNLSNRACTRCSPALRRARRHRQIGTRLRTEVAAAADRADPRQPTPRKLLADAIEAEAKMLIIGDYDCDGATATRRRHARAARSAPMSISCCPTASSSATACRRKSSTSPPQQSPDLIITVDNGIASIEGVAAPARSASRR